MGRLVIDVVIEVSKPNSMQVERVTVYVSYGYLLDGTCN